jgi:RHS repeat-associated protein
MVVNAKTLVVLGGNKQQLAVYNGRETSEADACSNTGHRVHFYPTEYLTYGNGGSALITTRPDGKAEYKIVDHLGSTRVVLNDMGTVLSQYDYEPFGKPLAKTGLDSRKSYIDKEKDYESGLGNYGVRSYDDSDGRFTSIDPLWENDDQRDITPYHYSKNNPIRYSDPTGLYHINGMDTKPAKEYFADAVKHCYLGMISGGEMTPTGKDHFFKAILSVVGFIGALDNSGISVGVIESAPAKIIVQIEAKTAEKVVGSLEEQAKALQMVNKANRVHMPDGSKVDLVGEGHFVKGQGEVKTPHVHDVQTNIYPLRIGLQFSDMEIESQQRS